MVKLVEAVGRAEKRTTVYEWDPTRNLLLSETLVGVGKIATEYRSDNRVGAVSITNLSPNGTAQQVRRTTYAYTFHANGLIHTITADGPLSGSSDLLKATYNASGDLIETRNGLNHTTTYSNYNGLGRPGRVTGANGEITDYTYDARGRVKLMRQYPNGTATDTKYEYNGAGLLVAVTTPDGHVRRTEYDAAHRPTLEFEQAPSGYHTRSYEYNAMSLPTVIKTGTSQYRPDTRIAGVIDGVYQGDSGAYVSGWACSLYFDPSIRVHMYVGGPAGSGAGVANVDANRGSEPAVAQACQASGTAYRFSINIESLRAQHGGKKIYIHGISPVGRGNSLIARSGTFTVPPITTPPPPPPPNPPPPPDCGEYQCQEPIIFPDPGTGKAGGSSLVAQSIAIPYGTTETVAYLDYDEEGRVRARRGNDGQNDRYTYDLNGNVETTKDSLNRVTTLTYDALDRLVQSVDAKLKPTEFTYDAGDRLKTVKDPRGLTTTYKYDGFGQLWSQTSPDTGTTAFVYDVAGRRTKLTRNDGSSVSFTHDVLGRVTLASAPGLARERLLLRRLPAERLQHRAPVQDPPARPQHVPVRIGVRLLQKWTTARPPRHRVRRRRHHPLCLR